MKEQGENVRKTKWFERYITELIAQYISFREDVLSTKPCKKTSLKGEIYFLLRKGKVIDVVWRWTPEWRDEEIRLPIIE